MADNINITPGTGKTVAADDIGGVLHQRIKISQGADGSATDVSSAAPLNVTLENTGVNAAALLVTLATLPIVGDVVANAGTNLNTSALALESGGNLDAILSKLNVSLGSRLASGSTLPITGTVSSLAAGGSLTAFQGGSAWLMTLATLPVMANITNSSIPVTGTFWQATQPVSGTITANQGTNPWQVSLATLPVIIDKTGLATSAKQDDIVSAINGISAGAALATVTALQGNAPWQMTMATLPVVANINNSSIAVTQSGTWDEVGINDSGNSITVDNAGLTELASAINASSQMDVNLAADGLGLATATKQDDIITAIEGISAGSALATVTVIQGDWGSKGWLMTLATLPVVASQAGAWAVTANAGTNLNTSLLALESGGNLASILGKLNVNLDTRLASGSTLPVTGTLNTINVGGTLTAYQGIAGSSAWLVTQATLPVMANITNSSLAVTQSGTWDEVGINDSGNSITIDGNVGQSGTWTVQPGNTPNTTAWLVTLATLSVVPATHSILNAGGSLSAAQLGTWTVQPGNTPNSTAWLVTQATLPVMANVTNSTLAVTESGTWTVQPGNTPNTTAWLMTLATLSVMPGTGSVLNAGGTLTAYQGPSGSSAWLVTQATLPVMANVTNSTLAVTQSGVWNVFSSLASGTNFIVGAKYMPTLASLADQAQGPLKFDVLSNLMVNTNVPLSNSTKLNRFYTLASMASLMAAPGAGKRLVVRELDFSGNATLSVKLVEDQGGTPATVWGPHYFLPYAGVTKTQSYIPITANKSLGVDMQPGGFNASIDLRVETENV